MSDDQIITLYVSTVSANMKIKSNQQQAEHLLTASKVNYQMIDIAADDDAKAFMRQKATEANKKEILPPQFFKGEEYLGDFEDFSNAVENEAVDEFLKRC